MRRIEIIIDGERLFQCWSDDEINWDDIIKAFELRKKKISWY